MVQNTIFILGAGPRIGWAVAEKFKAGGYKVAIGSRRPDMAKVKTEGFLPVSVDLTSVQSVEEAFVKVTNELGIPNVVVYNGNLDTLFSSLPECNMLTFPLPAANLTFPSDPTDPFGSIAPQAFIDDTAINVTGAYVSMREAVNGFKKLTAEIPKVFMATGNVLPFYPAPIGFTLGAGKASLTHLINVGVQVYSSQNFR
jgi:NAD(P)-dependent dehydrogenase (short-subunit alcohol dehydrogenase family)